MLVQQVEAAEGTVGLDATTGELVDLLKVGVIDPAKVTRSALENAASVAAMILTTEVLIADKPVQHDHAAGPPGSMPRSGEDMMGGMGGMGGMGAWAPWAASDRWPRALARWTGRPIDPAKLLAFWMEWEKGETPPGPGHGQPEDGRTEGAAGGADHGAPNRRVT